MGKDKRIIAVGDDDQCINNFEDLAKAEIQNMAHFREYFKAESIADKEVTYAEYSLLDNYRSAPNIVNFANCFVSNFKEQRLKQEPLKSIKKEHGYIRIQKYITQGAFLQDVVTDAISEYKIHPSTKIIVLFYSNSEVLDAYTLFAETGMKVSYIIDEDGFKLGNLVELQDFQLMWKASGSFNEAKQLVSDKYKNSKNFKIAKQVIDSFYNEHGTEIDSAQTHFWTIFIGYLNEIKFKDFASSKHGITVSTMHKAKGTEFDSVFMGVKSNEQNEYFLRLLYVAITRAKTNLSIYSNNQIFDQYQNRVDDYSINECQMASPNKIIFIMGLKDIYLSNEMAQQNIALTNPFAGEIVQIELYSIGGIARILIKKQAKVIASLSSPKDNLFAGINNYYTKGYTLLPECEIEYIVCWTHPETKKIYKQVLCKIFMQKS